MVAVVALPVMEAICFPVRACLLMMRLEAAASAVMGLSLTPPLVPKVVVEVLLLCGRRGGGGGEVGGAEGTPDEGTGREEMGPRGTAVGWGGLQDGGRKEGRN